LTFVHEKTIFDLPRCVGAKHFSPRLTHSFAPSRRMNCPFGTLFFWATTYALPLRS
jgi:hypothetical protein